MISEKMKLCINCDSELIGRSDKIYCDAHCKSSYQYLQIKNDISSIHYRVTQQLKLNRRLLKDHNKAGKATVRKSNLIKLGFNPRIFTHYWKTKNNTYLFVYDYGFMKITDNNKAKYSIVKWQEYMDEQIGL